MKLIFDNNNKGQQEIKQTLGFLDADFTYANIEPDIKLNTPYLIDLISEAVYNKVQDFYIKGASFTIPSDPEKTQEENTALLAQAKLDHADALSYMQLYILSMAYLDFAPNNDLSHSNSGRVVSKEDNDKIPWDWQINKDNSAIAKRAFKALDLLFVILDALKWTEWTESDAYKKANSLFIKNTKTFDSVYPINKSGQLYYRLVPFMDDFEKDEITSILTIEEVTYLKTESTPTENDIKLLNLIHKSVAYLSLVKAYKVFPVEMFPSGLLYNEQTRSKAQARAEVMQFLTAEAKKYLQKLEHENSQQNLTFTEQNPTPGLEEGKKYVNL